MRDAANEIEWKRVQCTYVSKSTSRYYEYITTVGTSIFVRRTLSYLPMGEYCRRWFRRWLAARLRLTGAFFFLFACQSVGVPASSDSSNGLCVRRNCRVSERSPYPVSSSYSRVFASIASDPERTRSSRLGAEATRSARYMCTYTRRRVSFSLGVYSSRRI